MSWKLRKRVTMTIFGVVTLVLALIVLFHNPSTMQDLLAAIGVVGGLAMILNALPDNGASETASPAPASSRQGKAGRSR
jgi:hypothetical protein